MIYKELEEKGYTVIDFLGRDEVQSLLRFHSENPIPTDIVEAVISATICSSDLLYRQKALQQTKKFFIPKTKLLFPNHKMVVCTFINKKSSELCSDISLHRDKSCADETNLKTFGIWCPLINVNEQNGCFYIVQKSHLLISTPRSSNEFPYSQEILSIMRENYLTKVPMKAGQALIYDNCLIHGSFSNSTDTERLAVLCILTPKDSPVLFYYRDPKTSNKLEVFEIDDAFYDNYIHRENTEKPTNAVSLGVFDYKVDSLTPAQLVKFMQESQLQTNQPKPRATLRDRFAPSSPQFAVNLSCSSQIALLVTPEYEGIFRNGGIGTYYTTLSRKLAASGWSVVLLLCQTSEQFGGQSDIPHICHIFSTTAAEQVLKLQPLHAAVLAQFKSWQWVESDSYRSLLFTQALHDCYPQAQIYVEFPDLCGLGYRTIQAQKAGMLGQNCVIAVTMHSGQEWLNEVHERFTIEHTNWYRNVYQYEQYSFENADLAFYLSYFLKVKVKDYGWETNHAIHLPYCFPLVGTLQPTASLPASDLLEVKRSSIPIIFFGRLEERKGLLTFLEAICHLDLALRSRLHIIFLGKSVPLHAPQLQPLTSQDYIGQKLGQDFTYSILTELFSQEAIALVRELAPAIVCLTSPQENLPNSAFEMGQLPIGLVVSDTGGFREPLNLIQRSDGIYWFKSGSPESLTMMLSRAIAAYPEVPSVPSLDFLEQVNQSLLEQRLTLMQRAFSRQMLKHQIDDFHKFPLLGMTSSHEQEFMKNYAHYQYSSQGEIVDLGCWLGSSTIPLAKGLEINKRVGMKNKRIHAYDLFQWSSGYMDNSVKGTTLENQYQDGESFLGEYLRRLEPWQHLVEVYPGDLVELGWNQKPIEYLFIDAMKSWELAKSIFSNFFPYLISGKSFIHHNDFAHYYTGWIHLIIYKTKPYFEHVCNLWDAAVFKNIKPIPSDFFQIPAKLDLSLEIFSRNDIDEAFAYSLEIASESMQPNVAAAKVMLFLHLNDLETAKQELSKARERFGDVRDIPLVMQQIALQEENPID